ncbi:MAG: hypothetical protein BWK78_01965 [Thiotrichaceae bacterium IS1]|nr:MAG: hypothetical protein BWK78_01965 [Thiotrichaceae bacterium IS1]
MNIMQTLLSYLSEDITDWFIELRPWLKYVVKRQIQKFLLEKPQKCPKTLESLITHTMTEFPLIDVIWVFDLTNNVLLCQTSKMEATGLPGFLTVIQFLGKLKRFRRALTSYGKLTKLGELKYTVFQLSNGVVIVYFLDNFNLPIALCFVSTLTEELGKLIHSSEKSVKNFQIKLTENVNFNTTTE